MNPSSALTAKIDKRLEGFAQHTDAQEERIIADLMRGLTSLAVVVAVVTLLGASSVSADKKKPGKGFYKVLVTPNAKWELKNVISHDGKSDKIIVETYDVRKVGTADVARIRWSLSYEGEKSALVNGDDLPTQVAVTNKGLYLLNATDDDAKIAQALATTKPSRSRSAEGVQGHKDQQGSLREDPAGKRVHGLGTDARRSRVRGRLLRRVLHRRDGRCRRGQWPVRAKLRDLRSIRSSRSEFAAFTVSVRKSSLRVPCNMWLPLIADVGVLVGAHGGVELSGDAYGEVGADVQVTTSHTPLTIDVGLDDVFDTTRSLHQLNGTALYRFPWVYLGLGAGFTTFALKQHAAASGDDNGNRLVTNVVAGARLDLGRFSPYVQATQGIGDIQLRTLTAGCSSRSRTARLGSRPLPDARVTVTPYITNNVAGDVQSGRVGLGVALAYFLDHVGFELDAELHGHFFRDSSVAGLMPEGVDLNTDAALASGSVVVPYCLHSAQLGSWCPYATAGAGIVHATFEGLSHSPTVDGFSVAQTNFAISGGLGIAHALTPHVAFASMRATSVPSPPTTIATRPTMDFCASPLASAFASAVSALRSIDLGHRGGEQLILSA